MKKTLLIAALLLIVTAASATSPADTTTTSGNGNYYQAAPQRTQQRSSSAAIQPLTGTLVSIKGSSPYKEQPSSQTDPKKSFWPRFSIQGSAGYAFKYFTVEGVLEYMQANVNPYQDPKDYYHYILGSGRVGAMLPIAVTDRFLIIPNVKGTFGGAFYIGSGISSRFQAGVSGGVDFGFRFAGSKMIALGFIYDYRWFIDRSTTFNLGMLGGQLSILF